VLNNLVGNAIKYSPEGGPVRINVRMSEEGEPAALLTIQDQGIGIPPADLPRIFDRFHRGDNVSGHIGGTGIGLTSARQIIEQHGGTISVRSELGRGSTFDVWLPLHVPTESTDTRLGDGATTRAADEHGSVE
jgi:signal transduction histidine kinase